MQYLRKQQDPKQYDEQRIYLEKLLARADALVKDKMEPAENDENALTQGLKTDESENWKKKALYD